MRTGSGLAGWKVRDEWNGEELLTAHIGSETVRKGIAMWWFRTLARPCTHSSREILKRLVSVINRNLRGRCPRTRVGLPVPFPKGKEPYSLMVDVDTFLTILYVMVDDFCQSRPQTEQHPGPDASLSPSEVLTLAIFARWARFGSERDFYRYANTRLRDAFPTLPHRSQFNRCVRDHLDLIEEVALHLVEVMKAQRCPYEALDSS